MPVNWHTRALEDLERILEYDANPAVLEGIVSAVRQLGVVPFRGAPGRIPGTREISVLGYTVSYRATEPLQVLAVLPSRPDPGTSTGKD
jgi:plasmid stabilization system protein ParE